MLDIKFIRENRDLVKENTIKRQMKVDIDRLLELDEVRRNWLIEVESLRALQNKSGEEIAKEKNPEMRAQKINEMKSVKEKLLQLEEKFKAVDQEFDVLMLIVPNMMQSDVPVGNSFDDNVVLRQVGQKPSFKFKPKDYLEIAQNLDLIDTERAAKVAGTRFGYIKNQAAIIEFAMLKLAMDTLRKENFKFVIPPVMIKSAAMQAMGYIDTKEDKEERYFFEKDDLYLVGTSEQSLGPMHMNEILDEKDLPMRYFAFSTCFRREAGSYGKDTRGILRVHQFDKVEMFVFCRPEDSVKEHNLILSLEEELMKKLELPYQVVQLCSADFARPSAATFDIEAWFPGENNKKGNYRETHSCSNCTDYQARRLNIKFRNSATGKLELIHTLNGTVFSQRPILALLENGQQPDGSVKIPKVLRDYCGFKKIEKNKN